MTQAFFFFTKTIFLGTVEQCVLDGLKKRPSGFRRTNAVANLFAKVAKSNSEVGNLISQIEDEEAKLMRYDYDFTLIRKLIF